MTAAASPSVAQARRVEIHQDEVLTGEAVALDVQPVGFFMRALGAIIDMLLSTALIVLFIWMMSWLAGEGAISETVFRTLSIAMTAFVLVAIPTAVETATRGRSLGRLAVGARIVRSDGGASGFRQALIRALIGVIEIWFTFGAVAALVGAFTPRSQRLGDLAAGTYSERTRAPRLPAMMLTVPPALAGWAPIADVARLPDRLARRVTQFVQQAERMHPAARARLAAALTAETAPFVSPLPASDPETLLRAVVVVRRERELRALQLEAERVRVLTTDPAAPRGYPAR